VRPLRQQPLRRGRNAHGGLTWHAHIQGASLALWLALAALVVVLDQFTKWLILGVYQLGDSTPITGFFNIVRAHNTGAAFSFWLAAAAGSAGSSWHWRWAHRASSSGCCVRMPDNNCFRFRLSMILGGALGNVIDRLQHGYVVDFLDFTGRFWMACSTVATSRPSTWPMRPSRPARWAWSWTSCCAVRRSH
jgi:signal peptidase II